MAAVKKFVKSFCLIALLITGSTDLWFIAKDAHNSWLVSRFECKPPGCQADFDADGEPGNVTFDTSQPSPPDFPPMLGWAIVTDHQQQLMRFPYRHADSTYRTHVAVNSESGKAHLIIYDGIKAGQVAPNGVFALDGGKMLPVGASRADERIMEAMKARDDTGSWNQWADFRLLHAPLVIFFYVPFIGIIIWLRRRDTKILK